MTCTFDQSSGKELWEGKLPVPAQAMPMTYSIDGRQFVVIADGGHGLFETAQGDSLIAYALP
jgi:quinoprotein glucose dehydrogenase